MSNIMREVVLTIKQIVEVAKLSPKQACIYTVKLTELHIELSESMHLTC